MYTYIFKNTCTKTLIENRIEPPINGSILFNICVICFYVYVLLLA